MKRSTINVIVYKTVSLLFCETSIKAEINHHLPVNQQGIGEVLEHYSQMNIIEMLFRAVLLLSFTTSWTSKVGAKAVRSGMTKRAINIFFSFHD